MGAGVTGRFFRPRAEPIEFQPPDIRSFWYAVAIGSAFSLASFWAVFFGAMAISGNDQPGPISLAGVLAPGSRFNPDSSAAIWFGVGLALMPVALYIMALMTLKPFQAMTFVTGTVMALAVWVWLPAVTGEPLTPTVAAYGAGGATVLGYRYLRKVRYRVVAVLFVTVYEFLFFGVVPLVSLVLGPIAILPAIGWADRIGQRRARQLEARAAAPRPSRRGERAAADDRKKPARAGRSAAARARTPQRRGRSGVKRRR